MDAGTWAQWRDVGAGFIAGLAIAAVAVALVVQASEDEAETAYAAVLTDPTGQPDIGDMDALAARFAVTIVWTEDERNCGGGCFRSEEPNVIYVSPEFDAETTRHIVLHEIGHVLHYRVGAPADECAADRFAQSMGSLMGDYCPVIPER